VRERKTEMGAGEMSEQSTEKKKSKKGLMIGVITAVAVLLIGVIAVVVLKKEVYRTLEIIECYGNSAVHRDDKIIEAYEGMKLRSGDHVSVNENSYVRMCFDGDKYVYLEGQALMKLVASGTQKDSRTAINLELGTMVTELTRKLSDGGSYEINSPNTTMAIRGTITVSEVRYELAEAIKEAGSAIKEADILKYLINTKTKMKEPTQKDDEVKKVFEQSMKAKVSSYVQQGKVELTVFEKTTEDGKEKVVATALPLEKGNGVASVVEEIIETEVLNVIEVAEDGTLTVKDTEEAKEIVKGIVVETERKLVETVQELETVVQTNQVDVMENLDEVQLQIDLEELSVSDVKEDLVAIWDKALGNWNPNDEVQSETINPTATPSEVPVATMAPQETLAPTPTEAPVVTEAPTPTEVPVATMAPQETLAPTPTEVPVVTEAPTPTEVPVATATPSPSPSPTVTPSPTPTVTPSPSPTPTVTQSPTATPSPTVTPSPSPTATPSPSPSPSPSPTVAPVAPELPPEEANFTYSAVEDGNIRLDRVQDAAASEIMIPGYVDGNKVVSAGSEIFSGCSALTTVRLRDDVDPESNLLIELITAALPCMKLREIYLPISYEQYLTEDLPIDQVQGVTLSTEGDSMVIRLQTSLLFLAPKLMELMQQYQ